MYDRPQQVVGKAISGDLRYKGHCEKVNIHGWLFAI
jgi:hypothetical protein